MSFSTPPSMDDLQIIVLLDWHGESHTGFFAPNRWPGALTCGFGNFAKRYGVPLQLLQFVYKGKTLDYANKSTEQLGMNGDDQALIHVVPVDMACVPPNAPFSIRFQHQSGGLSEPRTIKPSWNMGNVCDLYAASKCKTIKDFAFSYKGKALNLDVSVTDPASPDGWNSEYVRLHGLGEGDIIHVKDRDAVGIVDATSDPLDFVLDRQRVAKFDKEEPFAIVVGGHLRRLEPKTLFGTVVDYNRASAAWVVKYDGGKGSESFSRQELCEIIQLHRDNEEKDVPRVIRSPRNRKIVGTGYLNAEFENFLYGNMSCLSPQSVIAFWARKSKEHRTFYSESWILAVNSMMAIQYYLENVERSEESMAIINAHLWTTWIDERAIGVFEEKGDFSSVLDELPDLRKRHEWTLTPELTLDYVLEYICASQFPPNDAQPKCEGTMTITFLDTKSHVETDMKIDEDQTPASIGMKDDRELVYVYRKYEMRPPFGHSTLTKFYDAPENATYAIGYNGKQTIALVDSITYKTVSIGVHESTMLKDVLRSYADNIGISLRDLAFTHKSKNLFLSSAGRQTLRDLGIGYHDAILVSLKVDVSLENHGKQTKPQASKGKKKKKRPGARGNRKKKTQHIVVVDDEEEKRRHGHSEMMSRVFEEADSAFRDIRQRLAAMNLERTLPKEKKQKQQTPAVVVEPRSSTLTDGLGGKAGKTHFYVQVGEVSNLYKSSKPSTAQLSSQTSGILIDLHGLTKDEALEKLDESLPQWVDTALKGSYPWVIPVKIVVGGGNQILADLVEKWIKAKDNVSNAPKNL